MPTTSYVPQATAVFNGIRPPLDRSTTPEGELNPGYCKYCRYILEEAKDDATLTWEDDGIQTRRSPIPSESGPYRHWDGDSLESSALEGCPLCAIIWNEIREPRGNIRKQVHLLTSESESAEEITVEEGPGRCVLAASLEKRERYTIKCYRSCELVSGDSRSSVKIPNVMVKLLDVARFPRSYCAKLTPSSGSQQTLDQIASWVNTCTSSHKCLTNEQESPTFLPTRLVSAQDPIRIVESVDLDPADKYLTLSHCWGGRTHVLLTLSALSSFKCGIPTDNLPKTFVDAITVAKALGVNYIWIDSLCIIQDSEQDWLHQAGMMWQIYANSHLNLSATASRNSSGGLFRERMGASIASSCFVKIPPNHPRFSEGEYVCYPYGIWHSQVERGPVNSRGWVLQERVLSPRVVHFCRDQVFWECREQRAAEMFPVELPRSFAVYPFKRLAFQPLTEEQANDPQHFLEIWGDILSSYAACKLTKPADKLVAISALARAVSKAYGQLAGSYIAGIWSNNLPPQLCWSVRTKNDGIRAVGDAYRAPSWSWASVDGRITPLYGSRRYDHKVMINVNDVISDGDPYAPRISGKLHVSGLLLEAVLEHSPHRRTSHNIVNSIRDVLRGSDEGYFGSTNQQEVLHRFRITAAQEADATFCMQNVKMDEGCRFGQNIHPAECLFMPVIWESGKVICIPGLILAPAEDCPGQFRRIGYGEVIGRIQARRLLRLLATQTLCIPGARKSGMLSLKGFAREPFEGQSKGSNSEEDPFWETDVPQEFPRFDICVI